MLGWVSVQIKRIRFVSWRMYECPFIHVTHPYASKLASLNKAKAITGFNGASPKALVNANNGMLDKENNVPSFWLDHYPDRT